MVKGKNKFNKKDKEVLTYMTKMYEQIFKESASELSNKLIAYKNKEDLSKDEKVFLKRLTSYFKAKSISIDDLLENKDLLMSSELKQQEGSFFTPLRWAREAHQLVINRVGLEGLKEYNVWDSSCGSGNLLLEFPECKRLFLSTLNEEDIPIVKERVTGYRAGLYPNEEQHAFQLDFLNAVDSVFSKDFTNSLPSPLKEVILNNEKLAIVINPPYSVRGTDTHVGDVLTSNGQTDIKRDLYRQFIWQVCNLVKQNNLTNVEFVVMVNGSINLTKSSQSINELMNSMFNYRDGFLYPAKDFDGVSENYEWAISTTHWGISEGEEHAPVDVLELDTKVSGGEQVDVYDYKGNFLRKDFKIIDTGKTVFPIEVQKSIINWFRDGKAPNNTLMFPKINSFGTALINSNTPMVEPHALGYLNLRDTFKDMVQYTTLQSTPIATGDVALTEKNFDGMLWFLSIATRTRTWEEKSYQRLIPPVMNDYFWDVYMPNAFFVAVMMPRVSMYATRNLKSDLGIYNVNNTFFPLTEEQVLNSGCDSLILKDYEVHNYYDKWNRDFFKRFGHRVSSNYAEAAQAYGLSEEYAKEVDLRTIFWKRVKEYYPKADKKVQEAWDFYVDLHLKYLKNRKVSDRDPLSFAYDLDISQLRRLPYFTKEDEEKRSTMYNEVYNLVRELEHGLTYEFGDSHASDRYIDTRHVR